MTAAARRPALRVVLAGQESAGARALSSLLDRGHEVVAVVSRRTDGDPAGSVASRADRAGVPVRPPSDLRSDAFAQHLVDQRVDVLLNVHSLVIAADTVISAPAHGAYNVHPGLLPSQAGLNVPSWLVLQGAERHGVTVHRMTTTVDAGPVAFELGFPVTPGDTALTLFVRCIRGGIQLVDRLLDHLERSEPVPEVHQDRSRRTWYPAGPPDGGLLDWDRPAQQVLALVRACDYGPFRSPWGHPACWHGARRVEVLSAAPTGLLSTRPPGTVIGAAAAGVRIATADEDLLLERVLVEGRRLEAVSAFSAGDRLRSRQLVR